MPISAASAITRTAESSRAGRTTAAEIVEAIGAPAVILAYLTVNHDAKEFLAAVGEVVGPDTPIIGCSTQGIMGRNLFAEDGYIAGLMAFGGGVEASAVSVEDIAHDSRAKGESLARALMTGLDGEPEVVVVNYDPLCGVDMDVFLSGMNSVLDCLIVGGGASHPWGPPQTTYQYAHGRVMSGAAVAMALAGDLRVDSEIAIGHAPVGLEVTVTAAEANWILELDGVPAAQVWKETAGSATLTGGDQTAALSIGVPVETAEGIEYLARAAFAFDDRGGAMLQSGVAPGSQVMLHHRTYEGALEASNAMAHTLAGRADPAKIRAVLGFECGGRTKPFLGTQVCLEENAAMQEVVAPDAAWLGMLPWGEIHPIGGVPRFNNFTYPMVVISEG